MKFLKHALAAVLLAAAPLANAGLFCDFNSEALGGKPNGYSACGITFTDTVGAGLVVNAFAESNNSPALGVFDDVDGGFLHMAFGGVYNAISLDFGNDDPAFTNAGDLALLRVYLGNVLVGQTTVVLNRNDVMDQSISYSGGLFDNATFAYVDANLNPFTGGGNANTGLIEVVDNIHVPEPGTLMLLSLALVGLGLSRRSRR
jgi:hypothetical protein